MEHDGALIPVNIYNRPASCSINVAQPSAGRRWQAVLAPLPFCKVRVHFDEAPIDSKTGKPILLAPQPAEGARLLTRSWTKQPLETPERGKRLIEVGITIALAFATLATALRAAWFWLKASQGAPRFDSHHPGSQGHIMQIEAEATNASALNAEAALWSGATAVLSAITAIWGAMWPFFLPPPR